MIFISFICISMFLYQVNSFKKSFFLKSKNIILQNLPFSTNKYQIEEYLWQNTSFYIKRDDRLTLSNIQGITGNKIRKFYSLHQLTSFPSCVISYGGTQSNALSALAALCNKKQSRLIYFCKFIPKTVKLNPVGSYKFALEKNTEFIELEKEKYDFLHQNKFNWNTDVFNKLCLTLRNKPNEDYIFIPQGGAMSLASEGIDLLCSEILGFINSPPNQNFKWKILIASGTGTMALYSSRFFKKFSDKIEIVALPCVGSKEDLLHEMQILDKFDKNLENFPIILSDDRKRIFAKPYLEHYSIWDNIQKHFNLSFDLIYAPRAFEIIMNSRYLENLPSNTKVLYYHCGGLEGNESQLNRYLYHFPNLRENKIN